MWDYSEIARRLGLHVAPEPGMARELDKAPGPCSEARLVEYEQTIGRRLPEDYRDFLLQFGGSGGIELSAILANSEQGPAESILEVLYGNRPDHSFDLCFNYEHFIGRLPAGAVPVAADQANGQFCLAVRGENRGKVYLWDRQTYYDPSCIQWSELERCLVADSFHLFMEGLRLDPVPERLSDIEQEVILNCLTAMFESSYVKDLDFHPRIGLNRPQLKAVIDAWPGALRKPVSIVESLAINNSLNEFCNALSVTPEDWRRWFSVSWRELCRIFSKWRKLYEQ